MAVNSEPCMDSLIYPIILSRTGVTQSYSTIQVRVMRLNLGASYSRVLTCRLAMALSFKAQAGLSWVDSAGLVLVDVKQDSVRWAAVR